MRKRIFLILLSINSVFLDTIIAQGNPCLSMGTDTSFEYIRQIKLNTIDNLSGNNGGYKDFSNLKTELVEGKSYEITLTPGYKDSQFNESWNVWIDLNNDGDFEDSDEELVALSAVGQVTRTINIPSETTFRGETSMRVSMKYNSPALPCQIFSFGEVEDYRVIIADEKEPCNDIVTNGFETSYENWNDGGIDCSRVIENANTGDWCIRLRDNSGEASSITTNNIALSAYTELTIDFSFFPYSMEVGEDFWLQISTDGGLSYTTIKTWESGKEFVNETRYFESVLINNIEFSDETKIRFRCDASANADQVYIDDISINACETEIQEINLENINKEDLQVDSGKNSSNNFSSPNDINTDLNMKFITYPNPAIDRVAFKVIKGAHSNEKYTLKIIDNQGNIVVEKSNIVSIENYNLDVSNLINGIYIVNIEYGNGLNDSHKLILSK